MKKEEIRLKVKVIVFIDGCLSASYNDLAWVFGSFSDTSCNLGYHDQIFIGWKISPKEGASDNPLKPLLKADDIAKLFWEDMGLGNHPYEHSVYHAFYYVQNGCNESEILKIAFGLNDTIDETDPEFTDFKDNWIWLGCGNARGLEAAQNVKLRN